MSNSVSILNSAQAMSEKLPLLKTYKCRKDAMAALKIAVFEAGRHGIMVDEKSSGKKRVVAYCSSLFKLPEGRSKGRKVCILHNELEGFLCEKREGESRMLHAMRKKKEKEAYAITKGYCGFKAILNCTSGRSMEKARLLEELSADVSPVDGNEADLFTQSLDEKDFVWRFHDFANGLNYCPHSTSCTCVAVLTGNVLQTLMKPKISANKHMSGKQVKAAIFGSGSNITLANCPSKSSLYRQHKVIKNEDLQWYTENWARLEYYLQNLNALNVDLHVVLCKDTENRFQRMFIGYKQNLRVIKKAGLDYYGIDSCHVKHQVANGMQLHILVSSQGADRNVIIAFSLDVTESSGSYEFFGLQCRDMGIMDVFQIDRDFVPQKAVLFSDGMKGSEAVVNVWGRNVHHALCARHISGAARDWLKEQRSVAQDCNKNINDVRSKVKVPVATLHDNEIFKLCRASTEHEYRTEINNLSQSNEFAAQYMLRKNITSYSQYAMTKMTPKPAFCQTRITSGCVEGTNGVLCDLRKEDPYNMIHGINLYVAERYHAHKMEIQGWEAKGKIISPHATTLFMSERNLATVNHAYRVHRIGMTSFSVVDSLSKSRISHNVNIDKNNPSCRPCSFWSQHGIPCRHMILGISMYAPELLAADREDFFNNFFHPSFLVKNLAAGYEGGEFIMPDHPVGPALPEIIHIDSDTVEKKAPLKMLPPISFGLEDYEGKNKRGRPRIKRIRTRGAKSGDGEGLMNRNKNLDSRDGHIPQSNLEALMSLTM